MKGDFSRLKGDFSRQTFDTLRHYAGVLHQQGRVWIDADWNDEVLLGLNLLRQETSDIVGNCGAPAPGTAFSISPPKPGSPPDDFQIAGGPGPEGRYYVDGILCQLDSSTSYLNQPDFPNPPRLTMPATGGELTALVYLEVWQRLVTYLEDEAIREVALAGPDTATRIKTIAQVKVAVIPSNVGEISCKRAEDFLPPSSNGALTTLQPTDTLPPDPCRLPDPASYTGRENHLYRVEIHDGGDVLGANTGAAFIVKLQSNVDAGAVTLTLPTALNSAQRDALVRSRAVAITDDDGQLERVLITDISSDNRTVTLVRGLLNAFTTAKNARVTGGVARFKWSRDNASFGVRVTAVNADRKTLTLASLGRDQVTALRDGDLVEITDDASELGPAHGHLTNLTADPNPDTFTVTVADSLPLSFGVGGTTVTSPPRVLVSPPGTSVIGGHLVLRRWDGEGSVQALFDETATPQLDLGDGVHVQFGGSNLQSGDYWQFSARSVDGSIEPLNNAPPMGITRHRCALALVRWHYQVIFGRDFLIGSLANFPTVVGELKMTGLNRFALQSVIEAARRIGRPPQEIQSLRRLLETALERGSSSLVLTILEDCRKPFSPLTDPQRVRVLDEGQFVAERSTLNFVGAGVTVTDDPVARRVNISIPGGFGFVETRPTNLLFPFVTRITNIRFDTGISIANSSLDPFGTNGLPPQSGAITFHFFPQIGSPFSLTPGTGDGLDSNGVLAAGRTYVVLLSGLLSAVGGPGDFTGYIIAVCNFAGAYGFAQISDFRTTSNGYLAIVLPSKRQTPRDYSGISAGLGTDLI